MSKSKSSKTKSVRSRRAKTSSDRTVDVISQLECAARHPRAALLGGLLGGSVPWFARSLAHGELGDTWSTNRALALVMLGVILGCCLFSMLTVYKFGRAAFGDARKAAGFVLAMEGVMLVSHGSTSAVALALLIVINAIANGCVIALARDATGRRGEADARRSATRARNRARPSGAASVATDAATDVAMQQQSFAPAPSARRTAPSARRTKPSPGSAMVAVTRGRWISDGGEQYS